MSDIKIDVLLRSYDFTIDFDGQVCGLVSGDMGYQDTGIFVDDSCKNAINGEYTAEEWWHIAPFQDMDSAPIDTPIFIIANNIFKQSIFAINEDGELYNWETKECYAAVIDCDKWLPLPQVQS